MLFIDLTAFRCPVPLVRTKLALKHLAPGEQLHILLSDTASRQDVPAFLQKQGHVLKYLSGPDGTLSLVITKQLTAAG
ncbi:transcriptional regulator [Shewanella sp. NFH-SH190041]|uniref:sulfurtransferase TusA family protein n=1 Tax=Shewanella sp. NFH-SH190041 TaxID=2950245 RepID=UPI0021C47D25|nr:sulfurtransferase TusA family protein [Shewanella sp. NFH-SH190041]BDM64796.1 transcriptional regulator [Shewanella sp. NFH-SH190041]